MNPVAAGLIAISRAQPPPRLMQNDVNELRLPVGVSIGHEYHGVVKIDGLPGCVRVQKNICFYSSGPASREVTACLLIKVRVKDGTLSGHRAENSEDSGRIYDFFCRSAILRDLNLVNAPAFTLNRIECGIGSR